ncbi:MAG: hypothetical protein L3J47_02875 [Sulfurovum sp.]|nr:hypothetical protein [Sulfurovum sp.]
MQKENIQETLNRWLTMLISVEGVDLHLKTNSHIHARYKSNIVKLSEEKPEQEVLEKVVEFLTGESYETFVQIGEYYNVPLCQDHFRTTSYSNTYACLSSNSSGR